MLTTIFFVLVALVLVIGFIWQGIQEFKKVFYPEKYYGMERHVSHDNEERKLKTMVKNVSVFPDSFIEELKQKK